MGTLARAELGALTHGEASDLLGEGIGAVDATALYEASGGNPFYLEQLARAHARTPVLGDRIILRAWPTSGFRPAWRPP